MKSEKKFFLREDDSVEDIIEKYLSRTSMKSITLNIPQGSVLASNGDNLYSLSKKAKALKKEICIEATDNEVLELAEAAGIETNNPLFNGSERMVIDVIPLHKKSEEKGERKNQPMEKEEKRAFFSVWSKEKSEKRQREEEREEKIYSKKGSKKIWWVAGVIVACVLGAVLVVQGMESAVVTLRLNTETIEINERVVVKNNAKEALRDSKDGITLPGETVRATHTVTTEGSASGKKVVSEKAKGTLTVYNEFDENPQIIVEKTRFLSPEGKLFRLDVRTTIPGAKKEDGKLVRRGIEVKVTADEAGEDYNVTASDRKWTIPGFEGTPRYVRFYAIATTPMKGGFIGEKLVLTEGDTERIEEEAEKSLKSVLDGQIQFITKDKYKVLDGASVFEIIKTATEADGSASPASSGTATKVKIVTEGEKTALVFSESMLSGFLGNEKKDPEIVSEKSRIRSQNLSYENVTLSADKSTLQMTVKGTIVIEPNVEEEQIKKDLLGKNESALKEEIESIEGLQEGRVSLWPFWLKQVPADPEKIEIVIE